ncbi:MAG TPA: hypothetical protein VMF09_02665, partial [Solirubrobacteraceae bacterium]|nr:hypothetical protein [Solirubrobacteraceae bacterium]
KSRLIASNCSTLLTPSDLSRSAQQSAQRPAQIGQRWGHFKRRQWGQIRRRLSPIGKPAPAGSYWAFDTVSCPTSGSCVAVGSYAESADGQRHLLGEEWNGSRWELAPPVDRTGVRYDEPRGVFCSAALTCALVGFSWKEDNKTETLAERMWEQ